VNNVPPLDLAGVKLPALDKAAHVGAARRFHAAVAFHSRGGIFPVGLPVATAREGVLQAFHILNQFDIPKGAARGIENGKEVADYTLWTSVSDLKNHRYHFRTFDNSRIRMIDLEKMDLDGKEVKTFRWADKRKSRICPERQTSRREYTTETRREVKKRRSNHE